MKGSQKVTLPAFMTLSQNRGQIAKLKVNTAYINGGLVSPLMKQDVINF